MTATDELRLLLDERGVEYATDDNDTSNDTMWTTQNGGWVFDCDYMEPLNEKPGTIGAKTELMIYGYTPEQAIAATLGNGECENVAPDYLDFLCSVCGIVHYHSDENDTGDGNDWAYCPRCGKAVKR